MEYNSKLTDRLKQKMVVGTNDIISKNKMKGNKSALRSAKFNIGKIVNKQNQYDKNIDKMEKKLDNRVVGKKEEQEGIKAFKKGEVTYINHKGKTFPVSYLLTMAKNSPEIKNLVTDINRKRKENNFTGSLPQFIIKNYS